MSGVLVSVFVVILVSFTFAVDDKKWVWSNRRSEDARNPKYEVFEETDGPNRPFEGGPDEQDVYNQRPEYSQSPYRPNYRPEGGVFQQRPFGNQNRPDFQPPLQRPGGVYGNGGHQSPPHYGQNAHYPDILTGPVPSWIKEESDHHHHPGGGNVNFDHCKCTQRFNCNTPGISYGQCDVGKQYCCYPEENNNPHHRPHPHQRPNIHHPDKYDNDRFDQSLYSNNNNNNNRPGRPSLHLDTNQHSYENGILVGPGGPFDRHPPQFIGRRNN